MNEGRVTVREAEKRMLLVGFTAYFRFRAGKRSFLSKSVSYTHLPAPESGWTPQVLTYSGFYNLGVKEVWDMVYKYIDFVRCV